MAKHACMQIFLLSLGFIIFTTNSWSDPLDDVVKATGGTTVYVKDKGKNENPKNMSTILNTLQNKDKVILYKVYNVPAENGGMINFVVDPDMQQADILISGKKDLPEVQLIGPNNETINSPATHFGYTLLLQPNTLTPGNWTLKFTATTPVDISITAGSQYYLVTEDFVKMMLGHEGFDYYPYEGKLQPGASLVFGAAMTGKGMKVSKIEIIDLTGRVLMAADAVPNDLYDPTRYAKLTIPPQAFEIMVLGQDSAGHPFQRMVDKVFNVR